MPQTEYTDMPVAEAIAKANEIIDGTRWQAFQKATCPWCGERVFTCEPNVFYNRLECGGCGREFPVHACGFALQLALKAPTTQEPTN